MVNKAGRDALDVKKTLVTLESSGCTAYVILHIIKTIRLTTSADDTLELGGAEESNDTGTFYDLGEDW